MGVWFFHLVTYWQDTWPSKVGGRLVSWQGGSQIGYLACWWGKTDKVAVFLKV